MAISRNNFCITVGNGKFYGTSYASSKIYFGVQNGVLSATVIRLAEKQRLDQLAGVFYNDSSYWWVIAAASGIGWGLQVPPGTIIKIPTSLDDALAILQ